MWRDSQRPGVKPTRRPGLHDRRRRVAGLADDLAVLAGPRWCPPRRGVVPHRGLALAVLRDALGEASIAAPGSPYSWTEVHVELTAPLTGAEVSCGLPFGVEPAAAECVDHGVERRENLTPAGQAAQADPGDRCDVLSFSAIAATCAQVGCAAWSDRPSGTGPFGTQERRLAIEGHRVHAPLVGQRVAIGG